MNPKKITEREFSIPMLAMLVPVMNEAMELGFSLGMMILLGAIACVYAGLRVWHKTVEIKYACTSSTCKTAKPADSAPAAAAAPKPPPPA